MRKTQLVQYWEDGELVASESVQETTDQAKARILEELATIDAKSIRPAREGNAARLAALEAQAVALREELKAL